MKRKSLPHYLTVSELADLLNQHESVIRRMVHAKRCPPWYWRSRWKEPRFTESSIPEWLRILDGIDLETLPANPPALERPEQVFRGSRKATTADVKLFLSLLPVKTQERLRRAG